MMDWVSLTIDGASVRVPPGTAVLDAALTHGICIPALCHVRELTPIGACRVCIVEVGERRKVTASCTLEAKQGMVVRAHSDRVMRLRRNIVELLVAQAPNSRAIQDLAMRTGVGQVRYPFRNESCVLCGRCVRVCKEAWQSQSLGFVGRGNARRVALPLDERPETCRRCWSCSELCPMTITPCPGPMERGREKLCGQCESQLTMAETIRDTCVWCELGKGFDCQRQRGWA